jgi:hypothetical protein
MNVMQWQAIHWNSDTIACPLAFLEQYRYHLCTDLSETVLVFSSLLQAFRWNNVDLTNSHSFRSNTSKTFSEKKCLYGQFTGGSLKKMCIINVKILSRNNVKESSVSYDAISMQNFACSGSLCYVFRLLHSQITFCPFFLCALFYLKLSSHQLTLNKACTERTANDEFRRTWIKSAVVLY